MYLLNSKRYPEKKEGGKKTELEGKRRNKKGGGGLICGRKVFCLLTY